MELVTCPSVNLLHTPPNTQADDPLGSSHRAKRSAGQEINWRNGGNILPYASSALGSIPTRHLLVGPLARLGILGFPLARPSLPLFFNHGTRDVDRAEPLCLPSLGSRIAMPLLFPHGLRYSSLLSFSLSWIISLWPLCGSRSKDSIALCYLAHDVGR